MPSGTALTVDLLVGKKLRELRQRKGLSLRSLAVQSGLNVNTLSLIEHGKSSPSVGTLQRLAAALEVPITAFFELEPVPKRVVITPATQSPRIRLGSMEIQPLAEGFSSHVLQPFWVSLAPGTHSGDHMIVHTGVEFIYCLHGSLHCRVADEEIVLQQGDSIAFEAHLPHGWENRGQETAQMLLVLCPDDEPNDVGKVHFLNRDA